MKKLEDTLLWQSAHAISLHMLGVLDKHKEDMQYPLDFKLKDAAITIATTIAAGIGSIDPRDKIWHFGKVRASAYELKGIYKLLHDMKIIQIDPEIMLKLDGIVELLDTEIKAEYLNLKKWFKDMGSLQEASA